MRNTKKAFTLVELIVVITILAILGTIAFISLQGYSGEARDSKRLANINDLVKKMNIEVSKGTALSSLVTASGAAQVKTINALTGTWVQGIVSFTVLKENQSSFQDKINNVAIDYPVAYAQGGTGSGAYKFMQIATVNEAQNSARVVGNYYKMNASDSNWIIGAGSGIIDGGSTLPYSL